MKKILTLLVMFLATASILTAQTPQPRLNYQMIVRDANNALVYNTTVSGTVNVIPTGTTDPVYTMEFSEKTNMNGMLSIILVNQSDYMNLEKIDWTNSQFKVVIHDDNLNISIDTIMDIYPVVYAYKTLMNDNITTPRIVKYINNSDVNDVKDIDAAITGNTNFINALSDSVANAMKRNPGMVKQLAIYFLGKVTKQDVKNAFDTIDDATAKFIKDTIATYIKNHRDEAYSILKDYISQTTKDDVTGLWNAAMKSADADTIVKMVVDSVNEYIKRNPELARKTAFYVVKHLTAEDVFALQNFTKTTNPAAYDTAKAILNELIDTFMINNLYQQKNQCDITSLCDLKSQIDQFSEFGTTACPEFGNNSKNGYAITTTIAKNEGGVDLTHGHYAYELSFPGSNYPSETVNVEFNSTNNQISINLSSYNNRTVVYRPVMKQECMNVATYGKYDTIECTTSNTTVACQLPEIATFTHTGTSAAELYSLHGVALTATLTNNYYGADAVCGFEYKEEGSDIWVRMEKNQTPTTIYSQDRLTFSDTLKMNLCGKKLQVRPYVKIDNYVNNGGNNVTQPVEIQLREVGMTIAYTPTTTLTATNYIEISNQTYVQQLGTTTPSVEQIIDRYGASSNIGVSAYPVYQWYVKDNTTADYAEIQNATSSVYNGYESGKDYKVTCSFSIFNSEPCVLEAIYPIGQ